MAGTYKSNGKVHKAITKAKEAWQAVEVRQATNPKGKKERYGGTGSQVIRQAVNQRNATGVVVNPSMHVHGAAGAATR